MGVVQRSSQDGHEHSRLRPEQNRPGHEFGHSHGRLHQQARGLPHRAPNRTGHASAPFRWRLAAAAGLSSGFLGVELIAGFVAGSLALVSDAAHMATDVVALGASWLATHIAGRPDRSGRRSYGFYRMEVFASGLAVLLMLGAGGYVLAAALDRTARPQLPTTGAMLVVGLGGLVVNLVAAALLHAGSAVSLNVRAAYLEVVADAAGSVGVLAAGVLVRTTGSPSWDTAVGAAIGILVVVRAAALGRQVLRVLAQNVPAGIDPGAVAADLQALPGVSDIHDLHLWALTSGMNVATVHLVTKEGTDSHPVLDAAREVLAVRHGIEHATLQVEPDTHVGCQEIAW
jgi:cobalt-zinc-cadmium efflux system protein